MEEITPLNGFILVEPMDHQDFQATKNRLEKAGLFIGDAPKMQGPPNQGIVRAIAEDIADIKVGDHVVFNEPSPKGFKHDEVGLLPLKLEQICGVVND